MAEMPYNPQKLRVLIVDDHELIRKSIIRVLQRLRFEHFFETSNVEEAIRVLDSEDVDLVLCDLYLGEAKGFDILNHIRNRDTKSDIPFVVITGEASKDDIVKAADMGADDYVLKPFQPQELEKKTGFVLQKFHSPTPLVHLIRQAEKLLVEKEPEAAKLEIEKAIQLDPQSARATHLSALIYEQLGDSQKAVRILRDAIKQNPSFLKNYRALANLFIRLDNPTEAIRAMKNELELNPKQPERQIQIAKLWAKTGNHLAASEHYRIALLENPKNKVALFGMGKVQADLGNLEKAIYYFKRLRRHHPTSTRALEAIVQLCLAQNQPRQAEMVLKDEKKQFPKRFDTYTVLAKLYAATERMDDGIAVMNEVLTLDPEYLEGLKVKGALLHKKGELTEALEVYKKVIQIKPDVETYIKVAEVLVDKNAHLEATHVLHTALRSRQSTAQILNILNFATFKSQQVGKAYFLSQRLLQLKQGTQQTNEIVKRAKELLLARRNGPINLAS